MQTVDLLTKLAQSGSAALIAALAPPLDEYLDPGDINTPLRKAHFLAQTCFESGEFNTMTENLNYSAGTIRKVFATRSNIASRADSLAHNPAALGAAAYAGVNGNGPEMTGDGAHYRGRGLVMLTGRANYALYGTKLGLALVANPNLAADPINAVRIAIAYWNDRGCNAAADADDIEKVTRLINGGLNGLTDRKILLGRAKTLLAIQ
jgi:putative chitinase